MLSHTTNQPTKQQIIEEEKLNFTAILLKKSIHILRHTHTYTHTDLNEILYTYFKTI